MCTQQAKKLSFIELLALFKDLRLHMYEEQGKQEGGSKSLSYKHLLHWMETCPPQVKNNIVLQRLFHSLKTTPFGENSFKAIDTAYYDQCYRIVNCLRFFAPRDLRPWELTMMIPAGLSRTLFYTSAFIMTIGERPCSRNQSGFYTMAPTSFERVLDLMALVKIVRFNAAQKQGSQTSSGVPVKKRRSSKLTPAELRKIIPLDRKAVQRVGYACQTVVRSWDLFAQSHGFKDCEALVAPYILFDKELHCFRVILNRSDGFAPLEQSFTLLGTLQSSIDEQKCSREALQRGTELDSALRKLVSIFFDDLFSVACSPDLYIGEEGHQCQRLKSLEKGKNPLPARFASIPLEITNAFATATRNTTTTTTTTAAAAAATTTTELGIETRQEQSAPRVFPQILKKSQLRSRQKRQGPIDAAKFLPQPPPQTSVKRQVFSCSRGDECICYEARKRLEEALHAYVRMYNCSFEELSLIDESDCCSGGLDETAQLELSDPPFNYRRENGNPNSSHDVLTVKQMELFSKVVHQTVREGGQVILFCSPLQFKHWYDFLKSDSFTPKFNVDSSPLAMISRPGHFFGNIRKKTTALHPIVSWAVHATKTGLPLQEIFDAVDYRSHGHVPSRHPAWTNVIDDVARLLAGEYLRGYSPEQNRSTAFRPEQKCLAVLLEIICRFSTAGSQVVDHFAGTFSAAIACIMLPQHRTFVGCEIDPEVFQAAKKRVIEVFANSLLDKFSDINTTSEELLADAKLVQEHAVYSIIPDERWCPPKGFPSFQTLPPYHTLFLSTYWQRPRFHSQFRNKPVSDWPQSMKAALHCTEARALCATECSHLALYVAKSTIQHPEAGDGLFTARYIRKGEVIGYYYGALVYTDLLSRTETTKCYGEEGVLGVTKAEFETFALKVPLTQSGIKANDNTITEAYVVPKEFCACSKINDPQYRHDDRERLQATSGLIPKRAANVVFRASRISALRVLRSHTAISVRALRDIEEQEELFADYCAS